MSDDTDTDTEIEYTSTFPQARLDEMHRIAREFDRMNWERHRLDAAWDWTEHCDSGAEAIYLAMQLAQVRQGVYEIRYPNLKAQSLMPFNFNFPEGANEYLVETEDFSGEPVIGKDAPDDIPTVELTNSMGGMTFYNAYLGYGYSFQEAANAMFAGKPLATRKASGVRKRLARMLDTIAFLGHKASPNVRGLLNQTGTSTYATPADGAGGSKKFADKDPYKVLRDLNGICDKVTTATDEIEVADTLLLPLQVHVDLQPRIVGDGTPTTILKAFAAGREDGVRIERTQKLESNADWTGMRAVAYVNNPANIEVITPVQFRQQAPQTNGYRVRVNCHMRTSGLAAYQPLTIVYGDEIG